MAELTNIGEWLMRQGIGQGTPVSVPQSREMPVEEDYDPVEGMRQPQGWFGMKGRTRDVVGTIGDAFLMQAGRDPVYAPQRMRERQAEAMLGFADNPMEAVQRLARVDPDSAQKLYDVITDNQRQMIDTQSQVRNRQDEFDARTDEIAGALLASANKTTYPAVVEQINKLYASRGTPMRVQLPPAYDEAAMADLGNAFITPKDRAKLEGDMAYREGMLEQRATDEAGRNRREVIQQESQNYRTLKSLATDLRKTAAILRARGGAAQDRINNPPSRKGSRAKPNIKVTVDKNGVPQITRQ